MREIERESAKREFFSPSLVSKTITTTITTIQSDPRVCVTKERDWRDGRRREKRETRKKEERKKNGQLSSLFFTQMISISQKKAGNALEMCIFVVVLFLLF